MQLGFVIDHKKCIGCHACTIACKSENNVPLGSFRTWVKYTETGTFPTTQRSFAVLRCNQCSKPPCVDICPTLALTKGDNGIVDIDPAWCVGCKSCTMACPYDSIYINPDKGTAEKCHFCAHRVEEGLSPACAVVCPTEAIIPGDFDNPTSRVAQLLKAGGLETRKKETGTEPNVMYREAAPAGLEPLNTSPKDGYLWANRRPEVDHETEQFLASLMEPGSGRTTFDVDRPVLWGSKVSSYLMTKSLAAGLVLAAIPFALEAENPVAAIALPALLALAFLIITALLLILDLKRPERFLFLLTHPNWNSWLVRGGVILSGFGLLLAIIAASGLFKVTTNTHILFGITAVLAAATAGYTASLFAQAKGRVLWMQRGLWPTLIVQALIAGSAGLLVLRPFIDGFGGIELPSGPSALHGLLLFGLGFHLIWFTVGHRLSPSSERNEEYARAWALFSRGPSARGLRLCLVGWIAAMSMLVLATSIANKSWGQQALPWLDTFSAILALIGLHRVEHDFVRTAQELPIS